MLPPDLQPARMVNRGIRKVLPRSLLGRSLLMILLPLVLLQAVALQIFYGSHLDVVSRRLSGAVAGEIGNTLELLNRYPDEADRAWILSQAARDFDLDMTIDTGAVLPNERSTNILGPMDDDLASALREQIGKPFIADWTSNSQSVLISVAVAGRRAARQRASQAAVCRHDLHLRRLDRRHGDGAVRHRRAVHAQPGAGDPPPGQGGRGVSAWDAISGRSSRRAPPRCVRRRRRSIACRSACAASWCSVPRCWPASRTICARR